MSDDAESLRLARDTQLCSVPGYTPSASATSGIGFPVSATIRAAPRGTPRGHLITDFYKYQAATQRVRVQEPGRPRP